MKVRREQKLVIWIRLASRLYGCLRLGQECDTEWQMRIVRRSESEAVRPIVQYANPCHNWFYLNSASRVFLLLLISFWKWCTFTELTRKSWIKCSSNSFTTSAPRPWIISFCARKCVIGRVECKSGFSDVCRLIVYVVVKKESNCWRVLDMVAEIGR